MVPLLRATMRFGAVTIFATGWVAPFEAKKEKPTARPMASGRRRSRVRLRDAHGEPYLLVKHFDGAGETVSSVPGTARSGSGQPAGPKIPYRLPELLRGAQRPLSISARAKDADNLASKACVVATSASEGAMRNGCPS